MKKIGVIILVRYNSTRLPGKALKTINGKPILSYIIERLLQVFDEDSIVIATSNEITDDPIIEFSKSKKLKYYRGSLHNVAERFFNAAIENDFEYAIRINGDNIFVDINLLRQMKELALQNKYNFISNVKGRTFPKGMSIEIVRLKYFEKWINAISESDKYQEHVTLYLYEKVIEDKHLYITNENFEEASGIQLALDTQEDFLRTSNIINKFEKPHWDYNLKEIYIILKKTGYV